MKVSLSLLCFLPPSLGWYFFQLTTHACMYTCIYKNDMGICTAQSKPWSQIYAKDWVIDRKEDISGCMLTTWWFGHLWFSCSENCSFHTDRRWRLGVARMRHNTGVPPNFLWTAMALIWLQCLITMAPEPLALLVLFGCSSYDCLRIWPMSQGMRMVWEGR